MGPELLAVLLVLGLITGILSGVPVGFVLLGVPTLVALAGIAAGSFDPAFLTAFPARAFGVLTNPVFVALPLFVAMGALLEKSDIARRMMLAAGALCGERRGGIAYAVILVGALLAASTGVIGATIFMLGMIALPAMLSAKYSPRLAAGVICASGSLGQIIPPSILLILLADQVSAAYQAGRRLAGDFSPEPVTVGDLFAGALLPGLMLVGFYLIYVFVLSRLRPDTCPALRPQDAAQGGDTASTAGIVKSLVMPLLLILLVLGSILGGIATPTESAALGASGALIMVALDGEEGPRWQRRLLLGTLPAAMVLLVVKLLGGAHASPVLMAVAAAALIVLVGGMLLAIRRETVTGRLVPVLLTTATLTSMLFLIVLGATLLSLVFRGLGGDDRVRGFLLDLPGGVPVALFAVMAVIFLLGFILEFVEIIFIVVPVAAPPLMMAGVDPVWFAILISMNLQMSFLTPPFGYALFYFRSVAPAAVRTRDIYLAIIPFVAIQMLALVVVALFPSLATFLPALLY
ncbi:MAG: TRAP transporter large permease subunit [Nitratireductor sp.]|nr:TRAP transporter large permease subunit [Nitratireductor sp.]